VVSRQDIGNARQGHHYAVMHQMSKDSNRQLTYGMDRTLWRNLGLFLFLSLDLI